MFGCLAEGKLKGQIRSWGVTVFLQLPWPCKEQHSKQWYLISSWWNAELSFRGPSNCLIAGQAVEIIHKLQYASPGWKPKTREKFWDYVYEAALSQGFIPQGAEVNKGLKFRPCDCSAGGRQGWEAGTAVLPRGAAHTRGDHFPYIQPAIFFWVFCFFLHFSFSGSK